MPPWISRSVGLTAALLAAAITAAGCASSGAVPRPFPGARIPSTPDAPLTANRVALLDTALELRGVPYRNGGTTPRGFDCSGFTRYVFAAHGVGLPRETRDQFLVGAPVDAARIQAGDLLFFSTLGPGPTHVAIAIDEDAFIHAPSSNGVVRVERLITPYWATRFVGARRVL